MDLTINFFSEKHQLRDRTDIQKAFKNQLGCRPNRTDLVIVLVGLRDRIDLRWKRHLEALLRNNRQFKSTRGNVFIHDDSLTIEERQTSFNCRDPKDFSNRIGNYIIRTRKGYKNDMENVDETTITSQHVKSKARKAKKKR